MKEQVYRQKQFRFKVKQGAFVAINSSTTIGQIECIDRKGLSFWYIPCGESPEDSATIDIFLNNETFYLKCVPCKIVSDSPVKMDSGNDLPRRRQTVEFGKMKPAQQTVLKSLLAMYTSKKM